MTNTLYRLLPRDGEASSDHLLGKFLEYVEGRRLTLYPAQEEAVLELFEEKNVILNTPTGSGKSLVAPVPRIRDGQRGTGRRQRLGESRRVHPVRHGVKSWRTSPSLVCPRGTWTLWKWTSSIGTPVANAAWRADAIAFAADHFLQVCY
ncbi:MAG: hypothetical protein HZA90_08220 [Verrucomicrobia bacterium]|nr:hypothetical protein [Verrucomicrobiota bacterium]